MTQNTFLMGLAVAVIGANALPTRLVVQKDLEPVLTAPHPWTRYTYYFEGGQLVDSLRGMNSDLECTIELVSETEKLSAGDVLRVKHAEARDVIREECAEWDQGPGGDDYCYRWAQAYFPRASLRVTVDSPKVRSFYCSKRSTEERNILEPMREEDRISADDLRWIFGDLVRVEFR